MAINSITRGNVTWATDNEAKTVTVSTKTGAFSTYTVGIPTHVIRLRCGHRLNTGNDDPKQLENVLDAIDAGKFKEDLSWYNCIQCQKKVKIVGYSLLDEV